MSKLFLIFFSAHRVIALAFSLSSFIPRRCPTPKVAVRACTGGNDPVFRRTLRSRESTQATIAHRLPASERQVVCAGGEDAVVVAVAQTARLARREGSARRPSRRGSGLHGRRYYRRGRFAHGLPRASAVAVRTRPLEHNPDRRRLLRRGKLLHANNAHRQQTRLLLPVEVRARGDGEIHLAAVANVAVGTRTLRLFLREAGDVLRRRRRVVRLSSLAGCVRRAGVVAVRARPDGWGAGERAAVGHGEVFHAYVAQGLPAAGCCVVGARGDVGAVLVGGVVADVAEFARGEVRAGRGAGRRGCR